MSQFRLPNDSSRITVELHELIENGVNLWDFDYDSYYTDEKKTEFEQKVIDHFFFRQIGHETVGRFLHQFRSRVREIAPYYKQLYESVDLMMSQGDPFEAYNLTETYIRNQSGSGRASGTTSSESSDSSTVNSSGKVTTTDTENTSGTIDKSGSVTVDGTKKISKTPQGTIANVERYMSEGEIDNNTTATEEDESHTNERSLNGSQETENDATQSGSGSSTGSSETTSEESSEETYTLTRRGNIGVQPLGAEMEYYRKALINVDIMFIAELADLFLLIY